MNLSQFKQILFLILLTCLSSGSFVLPGLANADSELEHLKALVPLLQFHPSRRTPRPERTVGAGSRKNTLCAQDANVDTSTEAALQQPSFMALVPPEENSGLTLSERPTFWAYLPTTTAKQVVLSLRETGGKFHSQAAFPITGQSGITGFQLPADTPVLDVSKTYKWSLVLVCGNRPSPNDPTVTALVQRVNAPTQPGQLNKASLLRQLDWYSQNGIWYDAIASLVQLKQANPKNDLVAQAWRGFLQSAGLKAVSAEPLQSHP